METRKSGIFRLFIIMIFFCVSIFFLNNNKKKTVTATHIDMYTIKTDCAINFSIDQVYLKMHSLFVAHDIDLILKVMNQFTHSCARDLIEKMIQDNVIPLSYDDKVKIIYGMVMYADSKKNVQYEWLDLFLKYPSLHLQTPVLLTLARSSYADAIGLLVAWGKDRQKNSAYNGILSQYAQHAFMSAIEDNDYAAVETLFSKKVRIDQSRASELLWYIVENNKNSRLISLLINHAQADVNYIHNGKTLLIAAVEKNNLTSVRALLDEGVVVDRVIDNEVDTALTIAMKHNYHGVEMLLREYGA
jgi:hypothetical protein